MRNEGEFDDRLVLATLLDLVDRGYYDSKVAEGKEMDLVLSVPEKRPDVSGLEKYEAKAMDFFDDLLNEGGPCELGKLSDRIPKHSGKWRSRWESLTGALDDVETGKLGWDRTYRGRADDRGARRVPRLPRRSCSSTSTGRA